MKFPNMQVVLVAPCLMFTVALAAQAQEVTKPSATALTAASEARPTPAETLIPRLIKFSGTLLDAQERPLVGPVGVTFALYAQQTGGAALWMETQNVQPDANGNYTVLLGANSANGVPAELFVSGEARWLGIQVGQQPEHERILLVSVPYALKAGDAETLGGKPLSSFVMNDASASGSSAGSAPVATPSTAGKTQTTPGASTKTSATPQAATPCSSVTSDGTATTNSIALFTTACNVEGSLMSQTSINGFPGVNLAGNNAGLLLNGTGTHQVTVTGATSGRLGQDGNGFFFASDTSGKSVRFLTNNGTLNEWMRITSTGNIGIGTVTPAQKLSVAGTIQSTTGGFMFPDTTVQSSAGISQAAGDARYAQLGATSNTFTGSITASSFSGNGGGLTNLNAQSLNGLASTKFARLDVGNSFIGNQSINGGLGLTSSLALPDGAAGVITVGGNPFAHNSPSFPAHNTFVGAIAGNFGTNGFDDSGYGTYSLDNVTSGYRNTGIGVYAGDCITTGSENTMVGVGVASGFVGVVQTVCAKSSVGNTLIGNWSTPLADGLTNATAIGYGAQVGCSNCLVLGNGVNVGIGTSTPVSRLEVNGLIQGDAGISANGTIQTTAGISANGTIQTTADISAKGTVQTTGEVRIGSENVGEAPSVTGGYQGLVIRRINSTITNATVARSDTITLQRDGTASGWIIFVNPGASQYSIACLGLTSTTTVVGFTDSFNAPTQQTSAEVFITNHSDLMQFNCSFGDTQGGHMTEVNLLRSPGSSSWVGTVTSTYNQ